MSSAVFSDLDGTLIYSARHRGEAEDLVLVETLKSQPQAWMTRKAAQALSNLRENAVFIPTTTRVIEQYRRISLPGGDAECAIIGNGSSILVNGAADRDWADRVKDSSWGASAPQEMAATLERVLDGEGWVQKVRHYDNIACVVAHRAHPVPEHQTSFLARFAAENGCTAYPQGRKTHIIPSHITKEAAAAEIASRLGVTRSIASGDHELDVHLMRWADDAIQPAHGCNAEGIRKTTRTGAHAAEEIIEQFHRFMRG